MYNYNVLHIDLYILLRCDIPVSMNFIIMIKFKTSHTITIYFISLHAEKDLSEVTLATNEVLDWFTLGLHLKVNYTELKTIEANYHGNLKRCRQEMLMSWIHLGNARWDILVKVLQDDVHEVAIAEKIKKMLAEDTTNRYFVHVFRGIASLR